VTTNRIQRTVRMSVLSTFLALVAFSFLAFGTASAHTLNHRIQAAQTTSTTTTVVARIITNTQGRTVFSPSAITIKSGTPVRIVNKTAFMKILFVNGGGCSPPCRSVYDDNPHWFPDNRHLRRGIADYHCRLVVVLRAVALYPGLSSRWLIEETDLCSLSHHRWL
jgi:hypothetical protein